MPVFLKRVTSQLRVRDGLAAITSTFHYPLPTDRVARVKAPLPALKPVKAALLPTPERSQKPENHMVDRVSKNPGTQTVARSKQWMGSESTLMVIPLCRTRKFKRSVTSFSIDQFH